MDNIWLDVLVAGFTVAAILGVRYWLKRQRSAANAAVAALAAGSSSALGQSAEPLELGGEPVQRSFAADSEALGK